ncbi:hypothetical protein DNHGIG_28020 [Collibacillus ludicampi]|uniref:DUF445 family protein n=1 Tax=Collibacillus ludicampi TaxID=2771369 RepID=A0AAV4LHQ5_9BACL|nr:DUF445 family protein [Collibacillus ludicampi]GIM47253.1 hypothetical protein DNHGIG_28020 [Collibacillus ludicampi]
MNRYVVDFLILPLIGALHGWITNKLAIWLLFNPKNPYRVWGTRWQIQGVLPKRKENIANSLAEVVETDLLSQEDIKKFIKDAELLQQATKMIHERIMERVEVQFPRWMPTAIRIPALEYISDIVSKELNHLIHNLYDDIERLQNMIPIRQIVHDRLIQLDFVELEQLVRKVARQELTFIEWLGFYMGLGIGLVQGVFLIIIGH